ncbi:DUF2007 domain-containing protein [Luteithermobacter gelatinilyticus]|uniref:putative signal transducing protein n=1 Tax=Luteithermobacter gelatinilyticus TaxID=2582913 RepID=UPI001107301C|nr:DUF2007 domain-containing protein [Luteithermobacter gelatinilyticus]
MKFLFSTNDMVLMSRISALFEGANIPYTVLDANASLFGGGIGAIPRNMMVETEFLSEARRLIREAGLETEVDFAEDID